MKRTRKLATVAIAAVLGIIITTTTTIGTGIFLQQANASDCHNIQGHSKCSNENSFRSNQFNYQGKDDPGQPYIYHEHHDQSDNDDKNDNNDKNDKNDNND
jgi:hypothetical protein